MLNFRKKSEAPLPSEPPVSSSGKKGRPTPTRREAEARRQRPLVPADRKEAKRQARAKRDERLRKEQEALLTGDEQYMPPTHRGKPRRVIRDWVDSRWTISEFLLPAMLLFLAVMMGISFLFPQSENGAVVVVVITVIFYGLLIIAILES
ncbi:MAG: hypothetical protein CSA82_00365, partial [Actinobacteria bacterium]